MLVPMIHFVLSIYISIVFLSHSGYCESCKNNTGMYISKSRFRSSMDLFSCNIERVCQIKAITWCCSSESDPYNNVCSHLLSMFLREQLLRHHFADLLFTRRNKKIQFDHRSFCNHFYDSSFDFLFFD